MLLLLKQDTQTHQPASRHHIMQLAIPSLGFLPAAQYQTFLQEWVAEEGLTAEEEGLLAGSAE